ncbi:Uncharacterized protein Fot_06827 [Forsythia ovata]|uniref:Uncharacterized protein n=1 Tax=Forsythia ovata TaxID=205694 RepID=A0ABD1WWY4_9LAMI
MDFTPMINRVRRSTESTISKKRQRSSSQASSRMDSQTKISESTLTNPNVHQCVVNTSQSSFRIPLGDITNVSQTIGTTSSTIINSEIPYNIHTQGPGIKPYKALNILGSGKHTLDNGFITRCSNLTSNTVLDDHSSRGLMEQNSTLNSK